MASRFRAAHVGGGWSAAVFRYHLLRFVVACRSAQRPEASRTHTYRAMRAANPAIEMVLHGTDVRRLPRHTTHAPSDTLQPMPSRGGRCSLTSYLGTARNPGGELRPAGVDRNRLCYA